MNDSTQAMLLTGPGMAAIAVVRLVGPDAARIAHTLAPAAASLKLGDFRHTILTHEQTVLDDAVLLRNDDSTFEFHLHGGRAVIEGVLGALGALGAVILAPDSQLVCRQAWPDETTISREVLLALSGALTPTTVGLLARQRAALPAWVADLLDRLNRGEPPWRIQSAIQWVLHRSGELSLVISPPRVALVGPPNAGKSTLANALLGRPVSITSDIPGTTRDWVDATAMFVTGEVQIAVTLVDTAGVRETSDPIETESISRTFGQASQADLVLAVLDGSRPLDDMAWLIRLEQSAARMLIVLNKCDLAAVDWPVSAALRRVRVSAKEHLNIDHLMRAALEELGVAEVGAERFAFSERQRALLNAAAVGNRVDMTESLRALLNDRRSKP